MGDEIDVDVCVVGAGYAGLTAARRLSQAGKSADIKVGEHAHIDTVDISPDALAVARRNVDDYELQNRITLIESDLYANVPKKKYDLIITNPPYVNTDSMGKLPQEYRCEPNIALAGGADGMDLVRKIVAGAAQRLTKRGILMVEVGNERAYADAAFRELELTWLTTSAGDDMVFLLTADQLK